MAQTPYKTINNSLYEKDQNESNFLPDFYHNGDFYLDKLDNTQIKIFFTRLVNYVLNTITLKSVTFKGKDYYERSNLWRNRSNKLKDVSSDEIKYNYNYDSKEIPDSESDSDSDSELSSNVKKDMDNMFKKYLNSPKIFDTLKIFSDKKIVIQNPRGINKDHRGSDHIKLKLPFYSKCILEKECTIKDFVDALFNTKSHKFDKWYELYISSLFKNTDDMYHIGINYDHGS